MHVSTLAGYMAAISGSSGVFTCAVVVDKTPRIVGRCDRVTGTTSVQWSVGIGDRVERYRDDMLQAGRRLPEAAKS
jgi:hypothetical protein